eukprot:5628177-Amphidinium_carterae.1
MVASTKKKSQGQLALDGLPVSVVSEPQERKSDGKKKSQGRLAHDGLPVSVVTKNRVKEQETFSALGGCVNLGTRWPLFLGGVPLGLV